MIIPDEVAAVMEITKRPPIVFVEGHGSWLTDQHGKRYLDFIQGWAVNCLGHSAPIIIETLAKQAAQLINCSPAFFNGPMIGLASRLAHHTRLKRTFFANSGAEANEGAIKLARKWGQRHRAGAYEIITLEHAFHGRTLATMSASGKPQWDKLFEPKVPGFPKVPLNDLAAVANAVTEKTVAVMLEPIQGEAGVFAATDAFLRGVRTLCDEKGLLLILDEIQTGVGRTGTLFAYEHAGILPDILTLGKGIGGGVPLAVLVAREDVCCFEHGDQGGTFNGNSLMTAVGCAVLDAVAAPGFLAHVSDMGNYLTARLGALSRTYQCGDVRGRGLLLGLDLQREIGPQVADAARDQGLLVNSPRPDTLRFMPALTVTRDEIDQALVILEEVLRKI